MRHRNSGRALSRTSSHRKAMFANMCCSLIEHELIISNQSLQAVKVIPLLLVAVCLLNCAQNQQ